MADQTGNIPDANQSAAAVPPPTTQQVLNSERQKRLTGIGVLIAAVLIAAVKLLPGEDLPMLITVPLFGAAVFYYLYCGYCVFKSLTYEPTETYWSEFAPPNKFLIVAGFITLVLLPIVPVGIGIYFRHRVRPKLMSALHVHVAKLTELYRNGASQQIVDEIDSLLASAPQLLSNEWIGRNWLSLNDAQKQSWVADRRDQIRDVFLASLQQGGQDTVLALMMEADKRLARSAVS